jgi:hypothetical protein
MMLRTTIRIASCTGRHRMKKLVAVGIATGFALAGALTGTLVVSAQTAPPAAPGAAQSAPNQPKKMTFFITSVGSGKGADLGGLKGADAHCQTLAKAAGASDHTWQAYLSASAANGQPAVNAKDRIGKGPWFNAKGAPIATDVADLHSENAKTGKEGSLNEKGEIVNGRGDTPNRHDILTGSQLDGTLASGDLTCQNWTSSAAEGSAAQVGHFDRQGGGQNPTSFNSAHASKGCSQEVLRSTGGDGLFYCFAVK